MTSSVAKKANSFEAFLRSNQEKGRSYNVDKRKAMWIKSVNDLYDEVSKWLKPYVQKSLITIDRSPIELYEEHLGKYTIDKLDLFLGWNIVSLIPQGTFVLGGFGRIDLQSSRGQLMLFEEKWNQWEIVFTNMENMTWDFHKQSFQHAIKLIVDGE